MVKKIGMVNFPVDSEEYKCSGEGGLFVELWVFEKNTFDCGACCGYDNITTNYSEVLVGTEQKNNRRIYSDELFPNSADEDNKDQSRPLIACIIMGSTQWSGFSKKYENYWRCQYEDLNENGKNIYNILEKEYPKAELLLVTWLDT